MGALELVVGLLIVAGIAGTIVPLLPGLLLVWGAVLLWAFAGEANDAVRWTVLVVATVVVLAGFAAATVLPGRRAATSGSPRSLVWIVALGAVVGFFVIPVVGALVGGPIAAFLAELIRLRDPAAAWSSAVGAVKGLGLAVGIQVVAGVAIAGVWLVAVLFA
jgi:uncharacterized protein